jgi:hypothetical protein
MIVESFGTVCLDFSYCLVYCFIYFAYFWSLLLGADNFENFQELDEQEFE